MASATDALSGSPAPLPAGWDKIESGYQGVLSGSSARIGSADKGAQLFAAREAEARGQRDRTLARLQTERDTLQPPMPEKPVAMPAEKTIDPKQAWGSAAMLFAVFGSLLTKTPMNSALNAAAGALKAFHEADVEGFERQFKKWQVETTNATRMFQYQQQAYARILADIDRRERTATTEYDSDVRAAMANARAIATGFHDQAMLDMLQLRGLDGMSRLENYRSGLALRMEENAGKIQEQYETEKAYLYLRQNPEYQRAEAAHDTKTMMRLMSEADPHLALQVRKFGFQALDKLTREVDTSQSGKLYHYVEDGEGVIQKAESELQQNGMIDAQTQAQLIDFNTKVLTNGQAIRGFMLKLQQSGAPYADQMAAAFSQLSPLGGHHLSSHQSKLLLDNLNSLVSAIKQQRNLDIQEAATKYANAGFDPDDVYHSIRGGPAPSERPAEISTYAPPGGFSSKQSAQATLTNLIGGNVHIVGGERSPGHNRAVGGSPTSEHMGGPGIAAYDFAKPGTPHEATAMQTAAQFIAHGKPFDQILWEPGGVHIGWGPKNRGELAFAYRSGGRWHTRAISKEDVANMLEAGAIDRETASIIAKHYLGMQ